MQPQTPSGATTYSVSYEYLQSCTSASGSDSFDGPWDDQYLSGISGACPLSIKLGGDGAGTLEVSYV